MIFLVLIGLLPLLWGHVLIHGGQLSLPWMGLALLLGWTVLSLIAKIILKDTKKVIWALNAPACLILAYQFVLALLYACIPAMSNLSYSLVEALSLPNEFFYPLLSFTSFLLFWLPVWSDLLIYTVSTLLLLLASYVGCKSHEDRLF